MDCFDYIMIIFLYVILYLYLHINITKMIKLCLKVELNISFSNKYFISKIMEKQLYFK